ncbi:MAG: phage terminase large subunit [Bryobacteraceae bacterium]
MGEFLTGGEREIAYDPLPSQKRFHASGARFKGFSGSIGSGKSKALCFEALQLAYENQGRVGLIGAPTYPMLRDATLQAFLEILNANGIPFDFNKSEYVLTFRDTGSKVLLRSLDEFERLRGTNLAWFGVDELSYTAEEAWLRLEGRLRDPQAQRLCGFAVWTPKGYDWVYRKFLKDTPDGYEVVVAKPNENRFLLEAVPDFYERLKASYDEKFYRQEALGEYLSAHSGLVYREFQRALHVVDVTADSNRPLLWALDFNVDPMSSVVAQMHGDTLVVLDEIVIERASTIDACSEFISRYPHHPAPLVVYGDASGNSLKTSGSTDYEMIRAFFNARRRFGVDYRVPKSNPAVRDRILLVNSYLKNAAGDVRMYVAPRCKGLIKDFEEVVYRPDSNQIDKNRDPKRSHLSDALGYLIWQECRPQVQMGEQQERLI